MTDLNFGIADKDTTKIAYLGDQINVQLPENATTGFRWNLTSYTQDNLSFKTSESGNPNSASFGAAGSATFVFVTKSIGQGKIVLKLIRGTQANNAASEFNLGIDIRNNE
jgi:inhibitor of cysteine peptidase